MPYENELEHLPHCICTKNYITGWVVDHDCGRALFQIRTLEQTLKHAREIALVSAGQHDYAENVAWRDELQDKLNRMKRTYGLDA